MRTRKILLVMVAMSLLSSSAFAGEKKHKEKLPKGSEQKSASQTVESFRAEYQLLQMISVSQSRAKTVAAKKHKKAAKKSVEQNAEFKGASLAVPPGCGVLEAGKKCVLGFTQQIDPRFENTGADVQTAQMIAPTLGLIATLQTRVHKFVGPTQPGEYHPDVVDGRLEITPEGATALLDEAKSNYGYPVIGEQGMPIAIQSIQSVMMNPLRGGVYLSGLPLLRSGLPHLYFAQ